MVLEIGPDSSPSNDRLIADPKNAMTWDTVDFSPRLPDDLNLKEEYHIPIESNSYDVLLSGQVIEHVRKIWVWMQEVARVCEPGGLVITINPVSSPYHEAPIDCWRIFPEGMKALYDDAGWKWSSRRGSLLEAKDFNLTLPGRSPEWQPSKVRRIFRILDKIGFPAECAYDTITVGRKRGELTRLLTATFDDVSRIVLLGSFRLKPVRRVTVVASGALERFQAYVACPTSPGGNTTLTVATHPACWETAARRGWKPDSPRRLAAS